MYDKDLNSRLDLLNILYISLMNVVNIMSMDIFSSTLQVDSNDEEKGGSKYLGCNWALNLAA